MITLKAYTSSLKTFLCSNSDSADGMMVGLVTAQMTPLERSGVADSIGFADNVHDTVAYMLTLGVVREYRRAVSSQNKLVSLLITISKCSDYSSIFKF
jgi:hypothetical protein